MRTIRVAIDPAQGLTPQQQMLVRSLLYRVRRSQHVHILIVDVFDVPDVVYNPKTKESWYVA